VSRTTLAVGLATTIVAVSGVTAIGHVIGKAPARVTAPAADTRQEPEAKGPAPVVTAAGSKTVRMSDAPQLIGITGSGFARGMTATLVAPLGLATTYARASLLNLTPTAFGLSVVLDEPGTYTLTVREESGVRSNSVQILVR
jgi:hypothetical protein